MDYLNWINPDEMKKDPRLADGKAVGQIRCSTKEQAKKSLAQQQEWLRMFATLNNMTYVTDMKEAVSASQIKKRPDLDRIFQRKRLVNDFDTVIVQDLSRLTRGGVSHGLEIFFKFKSMGIRLVSLVDGLIDGDEKVIEATRRFQEARATAKGTALASRRGAIASRKQRKTAYTLNVPFGVDRMIINELGVELFRLRNLTDGSQQKLSPDGNTIIHTYPPNQNGLSRHHVKQPEEFLNLVPGAVDHVKCINRIFALHFVELRPFYAIARILNDEKIPSPKGRQWTARTVKYLLLNTVYLNRAIGDKTATGEFYKNGPSYPLPVVKSEEALSVYRPESEWYRETHVAMEGFLTLDETTKDRIYNWQMEEWQRMAARCGKKRGGNRHVNSPYILSGILREKITQLPLSGGNRGGRAYQISRSFNYPTTLKPLTRSFRAEPLEQPIKTLLREILSNYSGIQSVAESVATEYSQSQSSVVSDLPALRAKRDRLLEQIDFWVKQFEDLGNDYVISKTAPLKDEVVALGRRIHLKEKEELTQTVSQSTDVVKLAGVLKTVTETWDDLPNDSIKSILKMLVAKCEIDFETLEVDLELRLPSWAASNPMVFDMCLEKQTCQYTFFETTCTWAVPLGKYRFLYAPERMGGMTLLFSEDGLAPPSRKVA